jgi:hypothetical protein
MLKKIIDNMKMLKESIHCEKKFQSFKDEFCSLNMLIKHDNNQKN